MALLPKASSLMPSSPKPSAPAGDLVQRGRQRPAVTSSRPPAVDLKAPTDGEVAVEETRRRGRGAQSNASGRYEPLVRTGFDDGWQSFEELPPFKTTVTIDSTRKIITRNDSPDISFDRSINPYRGCEHGCIYCFARPTHAYLGLSPGLDFESKLFAKPEAPKLLERELSAAGYVPRTIAIGTNTDPYQPIEREHQAAGIEEGDLVAGCAHLSPEAERLIEAHAAGEVGDAERNGVEGERSLAFRHARTPHIKTSSTVATRAAADRSGSSPAWSASC
jgi:hypothetical protein